MRSWYVFSNTIKALQYTAVIALVGVGYSAYEGYKLSIALSGYEKVAVKMGFDSKKKQEAVLKAFIMAGYFKPESLWNDIMHMKFEDPVLIFNSVMKSVLKASNHNQINAHILRKNLFNDLSEGDARDLLLYIGQNAYDRAKDQERYQLQTSNWMEQYSKEYIEAAKDIGLYYRIAPSYFYYDEAWIAGASRIGVLGRLVDFNHALKSVKINGQTLILAGQRPLWAEIDGIPPDTLSALEDLIKNTRTIDDLPLEAWQNQSGNTEEGKTYMQGLANRSGIKLNSAAPFIKYSSDNCPKSLVANRTYPNTTNGTLTETIMANDLLTSLLENKVTIIDTERADKKRPDTATTARDAAIHLIDRIKEGDFGDKKEFVIYFQSNQPFVERQTIVTQREVNVALGKSDLSGISIKVDGVGFSNPGAKVSEIHSELGALIYEKYIETGEESARNVNDLLFSTRSHDPVMELAPELPEAESSYSLIGFFSGLFDNLL